MSKVKELAMLIKARSFSEDAIAEQIRWFWNDATKVVKNINETSSGVTDRTQRIIEFEEKYGLSKTHIV